MLVASTFALGVLHGLGVDHLMAIAALAMQPSTKDTRRRALAVALRFAAGHALFLGAAATLVIVTGWQIPLLVERLGEMAGGALLILLGTLGLWAVAARRVYGHAHREDSPGHHHWHLHVGERDRHPPSSRHSQIPTLLGAVFAVSGLRGLILLLPFDDAALGASSLTTAAAMIGAFGVGIFLSMAMFGVVLARTLSTRAVARVGHLAAALTGAASIALGVYWMVGRV
jgi:hypothetical protein